MRVALFCHSLVSDWNHGNAHFLRGVVSELIRRGHQVVVYEPRDAWSRVNLVQEHGEAPLIGFGEAYPHLRSVQYDPAELDLDTALEGADLVIVHEWSDHELVAQIGRHRKRATSRYALLFHDTHHRSVSAPKEMAEYDLSGYDGVLAFGRIIRDLYIKRKWARQAWTWHEAADTRIFKPMTSDIVEGDVVWIGNWGDEERTAELHEFLLGPIRELQVRAAAYGVRYPSDAKDALLESGVRYHGWLPNYKVPEVYSRFRLTLHIPRRPYVEKLRGVPTIRPFEALACGIPLISTPWNDVEELFTPGRDFLVARTGDEMKEHIRMLLNEPDAARAIAEHGRAAVLERHTCAHRVDELMAVCAELGVPTAEAAAAA